MIESTIDLLYTNSSVMYDRHFYSHPIPVNDTRDAYAFTVEFSRECLGEAVYDPSITTFDIIIFRFFDDILEAVPISEFIVRYSIIGTGVTSKHTLHVVGASENETESLGSKRLLYNHDELNEFHEPPKRHIDFIKLSIWVNVTAKVVNLSNGTAKSHKERTVKLPVPNGAKRLAVRRGLRHCIAYMTSHSQQLAISRRFTVEHKFQNKSGRNSYVDEENFDIAYRFAAIHYAIIIFCLLSGIVIYFSAWAQSEEYIDLNVIHLVRAEWRAIREARRQMKNSGKNEKKV
ncbi:unnamed protein product, partial [Mesorhabditis belari]